MPRWKLVLLVLLTVAAVTGGAWVTWTGLHEPKKQKKPKECAEGVVQIEGECIGVNGSGYAFDTGEIQKVTNAIAEENRRVESNAENDHEPYVTVAMMLPLHADKKEKGLRREMRSDLQGAYLGQRELNDTDSTPKIKLVLANPGRDYKHQKHVVDALLGMRDAKDNLRAVTGFNSSIDATRKAVRKLTAEGVPVLASRLSGDGISNEERGGVSQRFPGLARIIPTNSDTARALTDYTDKQVQKDEETVVVFDWRDDRYVRSLKKAFENIKEEGPPGPSAMAFRSRSVHDATGTGNYFQRIASNLCGSGVETVYFAGRAQHLRAFATTLADADYCKDRYRILSGSDAASLRHYMSKDDWAKLRTPDGEAKVQVQYAAPGHPDAWRIETERHEKPPAYLTEPDGALGTLYSRIDEEKEALDGEEPDLEDSRTMLVYDGLVTVGEVLHSLHNGSAGRLPGLQRIRDEWPNLRLRNRVHGTSGQICLTNNGNPYNKPISIVELDPGEKGPGTLKFEGLGWPEGRPKDGKCAVQEDDKS